MEEIIRSDFKEKIVIWYLNNACIISITGYAAICTTLLHIS